MKPRSAVFVATVALALAGCYWTPGDVRSGEISLTVTVPRGVLPPGDTSTRLRGYLYDPEDVVWDLTAWPVVELKGDPIEVDGYPYFEATFQGDQSGSFTVGGIPTGRTYRLYLQIGYPDAYNGGFFSYIYGVSETFVVAPGDPVDVAVELYNFG